MIEESVVLVAGNLKRLHVDQHRIKANAKPDATEILPVLTIQAVGGPYKAHEVIIDGPSKMVYDGSTLNCGAKCWIETNAAVTTIVHKEST
mgnify:CR=1 FL=1